MACSQAVVAFQVLRSFRVPIVGLSTVFARTTFLAVLAVLAVVAVLAVLAVFVVFVILESG